MKRFVLDASLALAWFVDRFIDPYAVGIRERLLRHERAVVPAFWRIELANGFVMAERRGTLPPAEIAEALVRVEALIDQAVDFSVEEFSVRRLLSTSRQFRLTAYDAEYLETARAEQLPLATLDRKLRDAAVEAGVDLVS